MERELGGLRFLSGLEPLPLLLWDAPPPPGVTYTSVVMNPVSSERKRKRMKRQQQTETARNNRDAQ